TMFGADLSGLVAVQTLAVGYRDSQSTNGLTATFFLAHLEQTASALAAMKEMANATASRSVSEIDGAWNLSSYLGLVDVSVTQTAKVISSARLGPSLQPSVFNLSIERNYSDQTYDNLSVVQGQLFLPTEHQKDAAVLFLADDKQLDSL